MSKYDQRMKLIGTRIKSEREKQNLSAKEFLTKIYKSEQSHKMLSAWETGKRIPDLDSLAIMAELFDCDIGYLLGDYDERKRDLADASAVTGLTGDAVERLQQIMQYEHGTLGVGAKGYVVGQTSLLSDLIESKFYFDLMNDISFYLIFGGALPLDAYKEDVEDLTIEEYDRFYKWANGRGLEIQPREKISEMYLQKACDDLKAIYKVVLDSALKKQNQGGISK